MRGDQEKESSSLQLQPDTLESSACCTVLQNAAESPQSYFTDTEAEGQQVRPLEQDPTESKSGENSNPALLGSQSSMVLSFPPGQLPHNNI